MYNIKKQIFDELNTKEKLPNGLSTIASLRSAQMLFNEIQKKGSCSTILSEVKDYYEKRGSDIKTTPNGWNISFETAEKKQKYFNLLQEVYKDGDIESFERQNLKQLQYHLGLSDSEVNIIEKNFKNKKREEEKNLNQNNQEKAEKKQRKRHYCRECNYERGR